MSRLKEYYCGLRDLWMAELEKEQREYEKRRCLLPNDGSDWKRLKF